MLSVASGLPLPMAVRTLAALHARIQKPRGARPFGQRRTSDALNPGRTGKRGKERPASRLVCGLQPTSSFVPIAVQAFDLLAAECFALFLEPFDVVTLCNKPFRQIRR